jgi:hypothetical protein
MNVTAMLCDYAVVSEGKLYVSGGGWTTTPTPTHPSALALIFQVPWDRTNQKINFEIRLVTADEEQVTQTGPLGTDQPVVLEAQIEVGRPVGVKSGTEFNAPFAVNMPQLVLAPDTRYIWIVKVEGGTPIETRLPFVTRP